MTPEDAVRVSVTVPASRAVAFDLFTREVDLWWRKGPQYRVSGRNPGVLAFEPGVGGRLFETFETSSGPRVSVTGTITAWDPPGSFAFEWRGGNFTDADPSTTVEVRFEEASPDRTRVTVVHRGWSALRADHPVRHGQDAAGFLRMMGLWWGGLMTSLREHAAAVSRPQ